MKNINDLNFAAVVLAFMLILLSVNGFFFWKYGFAPHYWGVNHNNLHNFATMLLGCLMFSFYIVKNNERQTSNHFVSMLQMCLDGLIGNVWGFCYFLKQTKVCIWPIFQFATLMLGHTFSKQSVHSTVGIEFQRLILLSWEPLSRAGTSCGQHL